MLTNEYQLMKVRTKTNVTLGQLKFGVPVNIMCKIMSLFTAFNGAKF